MAFGVVLGFMLSIASFATGVMTLNAAFNILHALSREQNSNLKAARQTFDTRV
jgi:hypothetical protein